MLLLEIIGQGNVIFWKILPKCSNYFKVIQNYNERCLKLYLQLLWLSHFLEYAVSVHVPKTPITNLLGSILWLDIHVHALHSIHTRLLVKLGKTFSRFSHNQNSNFTLDFFNPKNTTLEGEQIEKLYFVTPFLFVLSLLLNINLCMAITTSPKLLISNKTSTSFWDLFYQESQAIKLRTLWEGDLEIRSIYVS